MVSKLYLDDPYCKRCTATVTDLAEDAVFLDRTVFYPEGGGQLGDSGAVGGVTVVDAQKMGGRTWFDEGFPGIVVGAEVKHTCAEPPSALAVGDEVEVILDWERRYRLMRMHSAAHLAFHYIQQAYGSMSLKGCRIDVDSARFDFRTTSRFDVEGVQQATEQANALIATNAPIMQERHASEPEALVWVCGDIQIPCGGTHVRETGEIGPIRLKRRGQGKGLERLYVAFDEGPE
jgi:alanyl-tRNA synthetase